KRPKARDGSSSSSWSPPLGFELRHTAENGEGLESNGAPVYPAGLIRTLATQLGRKCERVLMEVKQFDAISAPTCERLSSLVFPSFFKPTSQNAFDRFRFLHDNIQIFISDAAQLLAKMKRRPLLIITARGGLVSELP